MKSRSGVSLEGKEAKEKNRGIKMGEGWGKGAKCCSYCLVVVVVMDEEDTGREEEGRDDGEAFFSERLEPKVRLKKKQFFPSYYW
jgi:hypothetical protein